MRRVSVLSSLALTMIACGPSARPGNIPPAAPDFARAGGEDGTAVALGDADDYDDDDDGGFGGAAEGAFDAAQEGAAAEDASEGEGGEDKGGAAAAASTDES
jgi:hypothetical protein